MGKLGVHVNLHSWGFFRLRDAYVKILVYGRIGHGNPVFRHVLGPRSCVVITKIHHVADPV